MAEKHIQFFFILTLLVVKRGTELGILPSIQLVKILDGKRVNVRV